MTRPPSPFRVHRLLLLLSAGSAAIAGGCSSPTTADVASNDATDAIPRDTSATDTPTPLDVPSSDVNALDVVVTMDATDAPAPDDATSTMDAAADVPADTRVDVSFDAGDPLVPIAEFSGFGEISGLQASRRYPGVIWGHRDGSGTASDPLRTSIYAFRVVSGRLDMSFAPGGYRRIPAAAGATVLNRNWEGIGMSHESDGSYALWLGDIGNNTGGRNTYQIYKFREPDPADTSTTLLATYQFRYPDTAMVAGAWPNCESLFVLDGIPYIFTKATTTDIYRFPGAPDGTLQTLVHVGVVREPGSGFGNLSYADVSTDGTRGVVGTHVHFWVYTGGDASLTGDAFVLGLFGARAPAFDRALTGAMITGAVNFEGATFMNDSYDVVLGSESQAILYWAASRYE